jgi:hypothetical protein
MLLMGKSTISMVIFKSYVSLPDLDLPDLKIHGLNEDILMGIYCNRDIGYNEI